MKILLVDDEKDICDFMLRFLSERNFDVEIATSGETALIMAEKNKPDLILLDVRLPDMDGLEILKRIKNMRNSTKVIMVTCVNDLELMDAAKNLGAIAYITKPLILSELMDTVLKNARWQNGFMKFRRLLK